MQSVVLEPIGGLSVGTGNNELIAVVSDDLVFAENIALDGTNDQDIISDEKSDAIAAGKLLDPP
ncbi:MAG: hypothetical protein WDM91_17515 [Rhizomicrobium sp.]